ncbi:regucalcin [Copidosoma floridanum]|uniref:regucalcin n=1 Tax=Copidosoma floridanum TaxID=29053 RepID=UPI000C6F58B6|nr:regucalcin [Copidosoma floridanum]
MAREHNGVIANDKGSLYRFDNDQTVERMLSPVSISNGLAWNSNNTIFYYIDSPTKVVFAFDYDIASGNIANKRVVFNFTDNKIDGVPDGMTIDANDNLWIAVHDGAVVLNVDTKTGELIHKIELPATKLTSVAFGGPDLDVLYVTSAYGGLNAIERQNKPDSGCVFTIEGLGVRGVQSDDCVLRM